MNKNIETNINKITWLYNSTKKVLRELKKEDWEMVSHKNFISHNTTEIDEKNIHFLVNTLKLINDNSLILIKIIPQITYIKHSNDPNKLNFCRLVTSHIPPLIEISLFAIIDINAMNDDLDFFDEYGISNTTIMDILSNDEKNNKVPPTMTLKETYSNFYAEPHIEEINKQIMYFGNLII